MKGAVVHCPDALTLIISPVITFCGIIATTQAIVKNKHSGHARSPQSQARMRAGLGAATGAVTFADSHRSNPQPAHPPVEAKQAFRTARSIAAQHRSQNHNSSTHPTSRLVRREALVEQASRDSTAPMTELQPHSTLPCTRARARIATIGAARKEHACWAGRLPLRPYRAWGCVHSPWGD